MTGTDPIAPSATHNQSLAFSIPARDTRGRMVRLGPVMAEILAAHNYPPALAQCLAEALVLTALMGSLLKDEGDQLTLQAQSTDGLARLLVCDYRSGELRGYIERAEGAENDDCANVPARQLFGSGHLAITFDIAATKQRYQGVVPLDGETLTGIVEAYFAQSEQVPTLIQTAVDLSGETPLAAGMLIQHLPEGEGGRERLHVRLDHPQWEHVTALACSLSAAELLDTTLPLEEIVWRLFHEEEEVRASAGVSLKRGCRCTLVHFETVLARFSKEDRREMADEAGVINVDCAFCSRKFAVQD